MTNKDFKDRQAKIKELIVQNQLEAAYQYAFQVMTELFQEKDYSKIVNLYTSNLLQKKEVFYIFEVAYSLCEENYTDEAEKIYEFLLAAQPQNSAILNNLSNIKSNKNKIDEAFDLIQKAHELEQEDEIITRNYQNLLGKIHERDELETKYKAALTYIPKENNFVLQKLKNFLTNIKKETHFHDNKIPIPNWKFKVLMETDQQKAESLRDQWLGKGYIRKTGERGDFNVIIYEVNPYIFKAVYEIKHNQIKQKWISGIEEINVLNLENCSYFDILKKIQRIKKKYRHIVERDFDELVLNYLLKNEKTVIVLSGSLVEVLLIYYCEKKKIKKIAYQKSNKTISRNLYECSLGDLLTYFEQQKILSDLFVHMGNISRIYRNFIHPGKELRETEFLNQSTSELCFISTMEIVKKLL